MMIARLVIIIQLITRFIKIMMIITRFHRIIVVITSVISTTRETEGITSVAMVTNIFMRAIEIMIDMRFLRLLW
jgi:hypothetical protein